MHRRPLPYVLLALVLSVLLAGCGATPRADRGGTATPSRSPASGRSSAPALQGLPPLPARRAPAKALAVGVRELSLFRGPDRPLPTTLWYPAEGRAGDSPASDAKPAPGRFPLVILSHGLNGQPAALAPIGIRWAAAGFIVAAPAYPHTRYQAPHFDIADVVNQPADASYVISEVLALDARDGDSFAGHVDTAAVAATGHSAGGITTTGMLSTRRDTRLRGAIVIAGALLGGAYAGPATPVLFVHGTADQVVSYQGGQSAYQALPWPKAFLTEIGGDHGSYLDPSGVGFNQMIKTTTDFLRFTLYGDVTALARLGGDATAPGTSRLESKL